MAGGDSIARKVLPMELSVTPPQPIPAYSSQPTGLPHVTPGLTGRHVLNVDNFNREQVGLFSNTDSNAVKLEANFENLSYIPYFNNLWVIMSVFSSHQTTGLFTIIFHCSWWVMTSRVIFLLFFFSPQLHQLFNLAHSFRIAVQKERPLDYILKVGNIFRLNTKSSAMLGNLKFREEKS